jgi:hypothetical protein
MKPFYTWAAIVKYMANIRAGRDVRQPDMRKALHLMKRHSESSEIVMVLSLLPLGLSMDKSHFLRDVIDWALHPNTAASN